MLSRDTCQLLLAVHPKRQWEPGKRGFVKKINFWKRRESDDACLFSFSFPWLSENEEGRRKITFHSIKLFLFKENSFVKGSIFHTRRLRLYGRGHKTGKRERKWNLFLLLLAHLHFSSIQFLPLLPGPIWLDGEVRTFPPFHLWV